MRVDIVLEVGAMTETVEVVQETPLLQTDRADTGRTIEGRQVAELPLGYNRNFQGLWVTVPGTVTLTRPHSQFFNPQDSQETKVNGQSRLGNNVQIDGLDDNEKTGLLQVFIPSAESIDSVNVTTSNFDAEFGKAGGSVTTVVLKSGTNQFRGSVFAFGNTESTQARSTSRPRPRRSPRRSTSSSAPRSAARSSGTSCSSSPTTSERRTTSATATPASSRPPSGGTAISRRPRRPSTIPPPATPDGTGRTPFPGNIIPPSRISPVAQSILALLPQPNLPGVAPRPEQLRAGVSTREKTTNAFNVKLNYNPTNSDQMSLRFSFQRPEIFDPGTFGEFGGAGDATSPAPATRTPTAPPSPGRGRSARA